MGIYESETQIKLQVTLGSQPDNYHENFWGSDFRWTSTLPIAWKNLESQDFSLKPVISTATMPDSDSQFASIASYWTTAIHLLGLGMGWTNIGEGLRLWSRQDYPMGAHPILDFLKRSYGRNLYSLELYFATKDREGIFWALNNLKPEPQGFKAGPTWESLDYDWKNTGYLERLGSRQRLFAESLLVGGVDPLHLEDHTVRSFNAEWLEPVDSYYSSDDNLRFLFVYPRYAGWATSLARNSELQEVGSQGLDSSLEVRVDIERLGSLGSFAFNRSTQRWFLYSKKYWSLGTQLESHEWGNPV